MILWEQNRLTRVWRAVSEVLAGQFDSKTWTNIYVCRS